MKKWSSFIFKFMTESDVVMLNTKNTAIISLERKVFLEISYSLKNPYHTSENNDVIQKLENMEFIIKSDTDEFADFYNHVEKMRDDNSKLYVALMTTTVCNFECKYCYEDGIDKTIMLNQDIAKEFVAYIRDYTQINELKELKICLYGGEPTLSWGYVVEILSEISNICQERNIVLKTEMITNGYLLNEKKIKDLIPFNLIFVQITLDGAKEYHDKSRYIKGNGATYDVIINNISTLFKLSDNAKIAIRVNCDKENIESVPILVEFLKNKFGTKRLIINFGHVFDFGSDYMLDEYTFADKIPDLCKILEKYGFGTQDLYMFSSFCMSKSNNGIVLYPNGDIYKCLGLVGREEYKFGTIYERNIFKSHFNKKWYDYCAEQSCCFLPICHSGCINQSIRKYNDPSKVYCRKEQLETTNMKLILSNLFSNN